MTLSTKRKMIMGIGGTLMAIGLSLLFGSFFCDTRVSMTEAQLQAKIDEKMPIEQKGVHVTNVKLDLSNDKINLSFDATTELKGIDYKVHVATVGTMRYEKERGSLYFEPSELTLTDMNVNGINVAQKAGEYLEKFTGSKRLVDKQKELTEKAKVLFQDALQKAAAAALERIPVYTLKNNYKGHLIRATLQRVEVKNHNVVAHISTWQLTLAMIGELLIVLLGIAVMVIICMYPGLASLLE